jgi:hypothetical protein
VLIANMVAYGVIFKERLAEIEAQSAAASRGWSS